MKVIPAKSITPEAVITVAPGENEAAISPESTGGINCPKACTDELIPNISPWMFSLAEREISPAMLANDKPLQIANIGTKT